MKIKTIATAFMLTVSAVFLIPSASAEQGFCSPSDPCQNWASVDNSGVVVNVIVCQASVCGANGSWGGLDPSGNKLVPQTAGNPVTGDVNGTAGYIGNPETGSVVVENNGRFTIIEPQTKTEIVDGVELTTIVSETRKSFSYEDSLGRMYGEIPFIEESPTDNSSAKVSAKSGSNEETQLFNMRKSANEIEEVFVNNNLNLLLSKIQTLISLLGGWVK
jgi:hypothetical protein